MANLANYKESRFVDGNNTSRPGYLYNIPVAENVTEKCTADRAELQFGTFVSLDDTGVSDNTTPVKPTLNAQTKPYAVVTKGQGEVLPVLNGSYYSVSSRDVPVSTGGASSGQVIFLVQSSLSITPGTEITTSQDFSTTPTGVTEIQEAVAGDYVLGSVTRVFSGSITVDGTAYNRVLVKLVDLQHAKIKA